MAGRTRHPSVGALQLESGVSVMHKTGRRAPGFDAVAGLARTLLSPGRELPLVDVLVARYAGAPVLVEGERRRVRGEHQT